MKYLITIIMTTLLFALPAHADDGKKLYRIKKKANTFFIAEVNAGGAFGTGFAEQGAGYALRASFGFGGAFRGFSPRFYAIGVARLGNLEADVTKGTQVSQITRQLMDFSAGVRVLVPFDRFRALFEFTMGTSIVHSSALVNARERYNSDEKRFTMYTALGGQYRLARSLSLGLLVEWALPTSREANDLILDVSRVQDNAELHGWTAFTLSTQFHF